MMMPIPSFPGYRVTSGGRIWSDLTGKYLSDVPDSHGYCGVNLRRGGRSFPKKVHRLALEAFCGPCPPGMEAHHRDGNRANNDLRNLVWGPLKRRRMYGLRNGQARYNDADIQQVRSLLAAGHTHAHIAAITGISLAQISRLRNYQQRVRP